MLKNISISIKDPEVIELSLEDSQLAKLIYMIGNIKIELRQDYFKALVKSIISQQLSPMAAATIYARFEKLLQYKVTPYTIKQFSYEQLRSVGVSKQKTSYLFDLSDRVISQTINLKNIERKKEQDIIQMLTSVKGIGEWTAEMFLIFSLGKLNILPLNDVGLQRAVNWLYDIDNEENAKLTLLDKSQKWKNNKTIACLYLWEAVNRGYLKYKNIDYLV